MSPELESVLRLLLAAVLGAIIGFQREKAGKPAGLRTHILIAMGSALFTVVSIYGFGSAADPSRIAAGIVTGIGFIGAGVIFRGMRGDKVMGITTAASIWITAAIGIAAGAGLYIIAAAAALVTLLVLLIPRVKG
ncbi:MAG: MgtC/SapB family protein [Chloroflexi bacterium]|nr:MgtC/SapB family protein [Chloroflexota bacterium]